jgi:molecular chaperone GrpE (heat shock protein)
MFGWFRRWFGRDRDASALDARRDAQALRLELAERDRVIAALTGDLERQRRGEAERVAAAAEAERERLLTAAASPASQLLTQTHLLEVEGKPVQARDMLAVARRLLRYLEDEGLAAEGRVGDTVAFDPDRHEAIGGEPPERGRPAVLRLVGITYRGRVLRKAGVVAGG